MAVKAPSTLGREFTHVYSGDSALDREHPDFNLNVWHETGEAKHLPCKGDEKPTIFRLRTLPPRQHREAYERMVSDDATVTDRIECLTFAVVYALLGAENLEGTRIIRQRGEHGERLTDDCIEHLFAVDLGELVFELGWRVLNESGQALPGK